ncbi:hypothetical protein AACH06_17120 [Ideonella sp. DXS29W]|uniref:Uncharacterized protein n=1 Tax=Ideonella lacteola TaxID=2984193 RepID=A0ABU9BRF7_9BURK
MAGTLLASAHAGARLEANLVFADLSNPPNPEIGETIRLIAEQATPICWKNDLGLLYIKQRPLGITDDLFRRAVVDDDGKSKKTLGDLLLWNKNSGADGFDGAIVYVNAPSPRLIGFNAKTMRREWYPLNDTKDPKKVEFAFCLVKPDIVRAL